ncbi:MAG: flagellar hook-length control protein FliK [Gammaproteobacteria bacterium]|nr:flagellar hook-length control protein FliK [Gammaproteobacteria bacterium]
MPDASLMLPVEAPPAVPGNADAARAPALPDDASPQSPAGFARLLMGELAAENDLGTASNGVLEPTNPDPATLLPQPLDGSMVLPDGATALPEEATMLPDGKSLPPSGGMAVPLTALRAERLPQPGVAIESGVSMTPRSPTAQVPELAGGATPKQTMPPQTIAATPPGGGEPETALPAAATTQESAATLKPQTQFSEEAVLARLAEREPGQSPAPRPSGDTTPTLSNQGPGHAPASPSVREAFPTARIELPEPIRTPQWNDGLATRITWMASNQVHKAELRLNPPELGPLEVRVAVQQDETRVVFTATNAAAREAVEAALPRLRELMGATGLNLVQVDVSAQGEDSRGLFRQWAEPAVEGTGRYPGSSDDLESTSHGEQIVGHDGLVDAYA